MPTVTPTKATGATTSPTTCSTSNPTEHEGGEGQDEQEQGSEQMLEMRHEATLWIPWTLVLLGVGAAGAFTLGYSNDDLRAQQRGGRRGVRRDRDVQLAAGLVGDGVG